MCGLAGSIGPRQPPEDRVEAALRCLQRRGPDASGVARQRLGAHEVCLVHTRLSIIDLDPRANQPFERDGRVLVYNGEIYNYLELRRELEDLGHRFRTTSDTEVLLAAYGEWGTGALDRLEGMWSFALLDRTSGALVLSRDRFGEKPFYYWFVDDTLYFASEVKALAALSGTKPSLDRRQLERFLVLGYKSLFKGPHTFYEEVRELPPATIAVLDKPEPPSPQPYWRLRYKPRRMSSEEAADGVRERLIEAVRIRLRTDVPLAFCLSGGIDSSVLAGIAAKRLGGRIHCFSVIDRDPRYDESRNIAATEAHLGCDVHRVETSTSGFFERLQDLVAYHDAPVITISYYVHAFLSEAIAAAGYKVAISGTAADELFTGYYDHSLMWLAEMHALAERRDDVSFDALLADWRESYGAFVQNPLLQDPFAFIRDPARREHIYLGADRFARMLTRPFQEGFRERRYADTVLRNRMMNELFHESVPMILHEDDRNSMRYSVENRSPYLDRALVEFAYTVPAEHLVRDGYMKWPLRAAGSGVLADDVRLDKRKRGFNASIKSLVDTRDPETRDRLLGDSPIFDVIRREAVEAFLDEDMTPNSQSKFLFSFISARTFLEHYRAWVP